MSLMHARAGRPAPSATCTSERASTRAIGSSVANAPLPTFTSSTRPFKPAASFFDRMLAVISGIDSTVAVTSRIEYRRRSAGASAAVCPTTAQPALRSAARNCSLDGAVQ